MEDLYSEICNRFALEKRDILEYSPLTLAYIGDAIYEIVIRTMVVGEGNTSVNKLHHYSTELVKASAQASMILKCMDQLSEEELAVYKRGRNAKSYTMAKNASMRDYRMATGFEALMGYLYMTGQMERLIALIRLGLER